MVISTMNVNRAGGRSVYDSRMLSLRVGSHQCQPEVLLSLVEARGSVYFVSFLAKCMVSGSLTVDKGPLVQAKLQVDCEA